MMTQFDVYENPSQANKKSLPFLIVLQHDRALETDSVVVAGLSIRTKTSKMAKSRLYPSLTVGGKEYILVTPNLASLRRNQLQRYVANLESDRRRITDAIDMLFTGV